MCGPLGDRVKEQAEKMATKTPEEPQATLRGRILGTHSGIEASTHTNSRQSMFTRVVLFLGLLLFAILLWRTGPGVILQLVWDIGWEFPLIWLPFALVIVCNTWGWWWAFLAQNQTIFFLRLIRISISAQAIQLVTPSIAQAGELLKIHLLRSVGVSFDVGTASVVSAKTTIFFTELLFIALGLLIFPNFLAIDSSLLTSLTMGLLFITLLLAGLLIWQRIGLFRPVIWLGRRLNVLTVLIDRHEGVLTSTDGILREFLGQHKRFSLSCLGHFLGWSAGAGEAWVFLLILGLPHDLSSALLVQIWLMIVNRLTSFVPGNIGTQEAGVMAIFAFLGLAPEQALAFALLRRMRQVGWIVLGLALLVNRPSNKTGSYVHSSAPVA